MSAASAGRAASSSACAGHLPGHIVEHITLELQNLMGFDVAFGRARGTGEPGVYNVVFAYREEKPRKPLSRPRCASRWPPCTTSRSTSRPSWSGCSSSPTSTGSAPAPPRSSPRLAPATFRCCA